MSELQAAPIRAGAEAADPGSHRVLDLRERFEDLDPVPVSAAYGPVPVAAVEIRAC